jgi:glutathione synthase/RimK-type ligase-like ATP-grasp enzyme
MHIALVTNQEYPRLLGGEVLLLEAFRKAGYEASPAVWNDPFVEWQHFDHIILRGCWGYHRHVEEFSSWLDQVAALGVTVQNPPEIVRWNSHKRYLLDLQSRGLPVPETTLVRRNDARPLQETLGSVSGDQVVIKPCYGASSQGVMKVVRGEVSAESEAQYRRLLWSGDVLVQEFLPEIAQGETSAVFFNNHFSHAVLRVPKAGEFRANYNLGVTEHAMTLSTEHKARVQRLYAQCEQDVLYARLDFVETAKGIRLMELELIEPYLFFDFKDGAADDFVQAFAQRIERK